MHSVTDVLLVLWAWAQANPLIVWPIFTAIVTTCLKARSPAQYAAMAAMQPVWFWSRFTPLMQLVGALGLDPVKALKVIGKVYSGKQDSAARLPGVVLLVAVGALGFGTSGCALFTKSNAKTVLDLAQTLCIVSHQAIPDTDVAKVCGLTEPFFGPMRELLASSRMASAKAEAEASSKAAAAKCMAPPTQ